MWPRSKRHALTRLVATTGYKFNMFDARERSPWFHNQNVIRVARWE